MWKYQYPCSLESKGPCSTPFSLTLSHLQQSRMKVLLSLETSNYWTWLDLRNERDLFLLMLLSFLINLSPPSTQLFLKSSISELWLPRWRELRLTLSPLTMSVSTTRTISSMRPKPPDDTSMPNWPSTKHVAHYMTFLYRLSS